MFKKLGIVAATVCAALVIVVAGCGDDKTTVEQVYLLYNDVFGVVEYEPDGDYPPPNNLDNFTDDNIMVTLYFGEDMDIYKENEPYGYYVSYDGEGSNVENFKFPFVPSGLYWLNAEFTTLDSCFQANTNDFFHSDTAHTFQELRPTFLGLNRNCWYVGLASVSDNDMVQVSERCWVTRKVYEDIYKDRMENGNLIEP